MLLTGAFALAMAYAASPASAAFPGRNGQIAFSAIAPDDDSPIQSGPDECVNACGGVFLLAGSRVRATDFAGEHPVFSPDGKRLARVLESGTIEIDRLDGSGHRTVWLPRPLEASSAAWAPDGKRLVVSASGARGGGEFGCSRLYVVRVSSGATRRLLSGCDDADPTWSSRGWIAFVRHTDQLWRVRADGSGLRRIAKNVESARWSPRGRYLAFLRVSDSTEFQSIYVAHADGARPRRAVRAKTMSSDRDPFAWSPDGKWIAYSAAIDGGTDFKKVPWRGGQPRLITRTKKAYNTDGLDWQPKR